MPDIQPQWFKRLCQEACREMAEAGGGKLITTLGLSTFSICLHYVRERAAWPAVIVAQRAFWETYRSQAEGIKTIWIHGYDYSEQARREDIELIIISDSALQHWEEWLASIKPQILIAYPGELFRLAAMSKRADAFLRLSRQCGEAWTVLHNPTPVDLGDGKTIINLCGIAARIEKEH